MAESAVEEKQSEGFPVTFLPLGKRVTCSGDQVLLQVARAHGIRIGAACGGRGRCRSCAIRLEGTVPEAGPTDLRDFTSDEISAGWRRACQVRPTGPCTVHVPAKTAASTLTLGQDAGMDRVTIHSPVLVPEGNGYWRRGNHRVGPIAGDRAYGLAIDLGTTNIAAGLVDMQSGQVVAAGAKENPQSVFGADVITRAMHALQSKNSAGELQRLDVEAITELAHHLTGGHPETVAEVAVVGNSVMQHLLLGLSLETLVRVPYQPKVFDATDQLASDLGLNLAPGAWLHVGPNIAGFVGSDHVAALLEVMQAPPPGRWALLDIGTNTEISLFVDGQLTSVSCASGPAFEGGVLSCGMRAAPGAIERVGINGNGIRLQVIGNEEPIGICGSGVLSLMAELLRGGAMNAGGRLSTDHPKVRERGYRIEFVLADECQTGALPLVFTQQDVRAVQVAKAAIRAGLDLLLAGAGLVEADLDRVIVAGAFGKYLDLGEAIAIGLFPALPLERFEQPGNVAGSGVRRMVACEDSRAHSHQLARQAHYLELASRPEFQKTFIGRIPL